MPTREAVLEQDRRRAASMQVARTLAASGLGLVDVARLLDETPDAVRSWLAEAEGTIAEREGLGQKTVSEILVEMARLPKALESPAATYADAFATKPSRPQEREEPPPATPVEPSPPAQPEAPPRRRPRKPEAELGAAPYPPPTTRLQCVTEAPHSLRPCPWVGCRHYLPSDACSCALDYVAANPTGATLEEIATVFGITRERVRQVEERALDKLSMGERGELAGELLAV